MSSMSPGLHRRFLEARALPQSHSSWLLTNKSPVSLVSKASSSSIAKTAKLLKTEIGKEVLAVGREPFLKGLKGAVSGTGRWGKRKKFESGSRDIFKKNHR